MSAQPLKPTSFQPRSSATICTMLGFLSVCARPAELEIRKVASAARRTRWFMGGVSVPKSRQGLSRARNSRFGAGTAIPVDTPRPCDLTGRFETAQVERYVFTFMLATVSGFRRAPDEIALRVRVSPVDTCVA